MNPLLSERDLCKQLFSKLFPHDVIEIIFEYHIIYKEIFDEILRKDIKIANPDLFYVNNWTGPKLLFAYVLENKSSVISEPYTILADITLSTQELYGKRRNWNRRAHILEFYPEFVGHFLKLIFEGYEDDFFITIIHRFVHINRIFMMPPSLQEILYFDDNGLDNELYSHEFTNQTYHRIIREIQENIYSNH